MKDSVLVRNILLKNQDLEYQKFSAKLSPELPFDYFIGVRVPVIRQLSKELNESVAEDFLNSLPHESLEENQLHGFILQRNKNIEECIDKINKFLPYIKSWAECDSFTPKIFYKYKDRVLVEIKKWLSSKYTFEVRFGVIVLMNLFLDKDDFKKEYLDLLSRIDTNEYYINIAIAWFYASALIKQWDDAIKIFENKCLNKWVHNKSIQKAIESFRITPERKDYLRSLKMK